MIFSDARTQAAYNALAQQKHERRIKAEQIAKEAAWSDLPSNERVTYMELAFQALKAIEKERTN